MKKIIKNKKADVFMALDFYAILLLAIGVILLFILVTVLKSGDKNDITKSVQGINFPHFVLNVFESEIIDMSECPNAAVNMTRKDALIWFDSIKYNIINEKKENEYKTCVSNFQYSLLKLRSNNFNNLDLVYEDSLFFKIHITNWPESLDLNFMFGGYTDIFIFNIPGKNENIVIEIISLDLTDDINRDFIIET